jgi:hypothetical protein
VLTKDRLEVLTAANVAVEKVEFPNGLKPGVVRRRSRTSEIIDDNDTLAAPQQFCREIAANESTAPGHQISQ